MTCEYFSGTTIWGMCNKKYIKTSTLKKTARPYFKLFIRFCQHIANFLTTLKLEVCECSALTTRRFTHLSFPYSAARQSRCKHVSGVIINGWWASSLAATTWIAHAHSTKFHVLCKLAFLQPISLARLTGALAKANIKLTQVDI